MSLVMLCALPWFRRPEAWLAALFAAAIFIPACTTRFARGRPYLLTDAVLITILFLWSRQEKDRPRRAGVSIFTALLVAASAWIHGSWYLLVLPGAAILFAGFWRSAILLWRLLAGGKFFWLRADRPSVGIFIPIRAAHVRRLRTFCRQPPIGAGMASVRRRNFRRARGGRPAFMARKIFLGWNPRAVLNPVFMMMVLGWLLGLKVRRFWWDFGMPAFMVWVALELQEHFERHLCLRFGQASVRHAGNRRRSFSGIHQRPRQPLDGESHDGISHARNARARRLAARITAASFTIPTWTFFTRPFIKNPTAHWRYVLGFEPGLMRAGRSGSASQNPMELWRRVRAYEPWVKKMRPEDRMFIHAKHGGAAGLPGLEWHYAATGLWIGRLPRPASTAPPPNSQPDGTPK